MSKTIDERVDVTSVPGNATEPSKWVVTYDAPGSRKLREVVSFTDADGMAAYYFRQGFVAGLKEEKRP